MAACSSISTISSTIRRYFLRFLKIFWASPHQNNGPLISRSPGKLKGIATYSNLLVASPRTRRKPSLSLLQRNVWEEHRACFDHCLFPCPSPGLVIFRCIFPRCQLDSVVWRSFVLFFFVLFLASSSWLSLQSRVFRRVSELSRSIRAEPHRGPSL